MMTMNDLMKMNDLMYGFDVGLANECLVMNVGDDEE